MLRVNSFEFLVYSGKFDSCFVENCSCVVEVPQTACE